MICATCRHDKEFHDRGHCWHYLLGKTYCTCKEFVLLGEKGIVPIVLIVVGAIFLGVWIAAKVNYAHGY